MQWRLVLNNRTDNAISDKDMCSLFHQHLKYYKFRRVPTKTGRSIFYLFFHKEEDTYAALRASKAMKEISLVRYRPSNPIDYEQPVPVAAARAQAFYGLRETPKLCAGRVKLQLALLSPAGRPVAITGDLAGFWAGAWADVRKDMRGRYPRHDWPEDPGK